jgi:hypothetical protein
MIEGSGYVSLTNGSGSATLIVGLLYDDEFSALANMGAFVEHPVPYLVVCTTDI